MCVVGEGIKLSTMPIGSTRGQIFKSAQNELSAPGDTYLSPKNFFQLLSFNYPGKLPYFRDSQFCDYCHSDRIFSKELKMHF